MTAAAAATFLGRAWSVWWLGVIAWVALREWAGERRLRRELQRVEREQPS